MWHFFQFLVQFSLFQHIYLINFCTIFATSGPFTVISWIIFFFFIWEYSIESHIPRNVYICIEMMVPRNLIIIVNILSTYRHFWIEINENRRNKDRWAFDFLIYRNLTKEHVPCPFSIKFKNESSSFASFCYSAFGNWPGQHCSIQISHGSRYILILLKKYPSSILLMFSYNFSSKFCSGMKLKI